VGTPGYRNEYQISTYSPVGTPGYRNEYQIPTYSLVGTPGYINEYQISHRIICRYLIFISISGLPQENV
jgi:uncharacterized protein (UPF0297 family)